MPGLKERATRTVTRLRARYAWLDHTVRTVQHYGVVNGNAQAGAVTYFGFLSFFPILALGFFVVGLFAQVYPDLRAELVKELNQLLPGVIGPGKGQIHLSTIEDASATVGLIGLVGLLYAGLGWLSATRNALQVMFVVPRREKPSFVGGKGRDLGALVAIGLVLLLSVVLSSAVTGFSGTIVAWLGFERSSTGPTVLLNLVGHLLAIAASVGLLLTMFKLLLEPHVPRSALVRGALLGALAFEVLQLVANLLLAQTRGNPAFQAFGVSLILLVWINYFSRVVMYAAAWCYTSPAALDRRTTGAMRAPGAVLTIEPEPPEPPAGPGASRSAPRGTPSRSPWPAAAAAGALTLIAAVALRGRRRGGPR